MKDDLESEWLDNQSRLHGINVLLKYLVKEKMPCRLFAWLTGDEDLGKP